MAANYSAHLRFSDEIPDDVAESIREYARVGKRGRVTVFELEFSDWERILTTIWEAGVRRLACFPMLHDRTAFDWTSPPSDWIGAILGPDYVSAPMNPDTDFGDSCVNKPCRGLVAEGRAIVTGERPSGHMACIGDELVVSESMLRRLGAESTGVVCDTRGNNLGWYRFRTFDESHVLSNDSIGPSTLCAICGTTLVPELGLWLGDSDAQAPTGFATDSLGFSHLSLRHPIVVSISEAIALERDFRGRGYSLEPIHAFDSSTALLARSFRSELLSLFELG